MPRAGLSARSPADPPAGGSYFSAAAAGASGPGSRVRWSLSSKISPHGKREPLSGSLQTIGKVRGLFRSSAKMPLLSRRCAAEKSSLRSLNTLLCKAFRAFDPTRGGLPPLELPPAKMRAKSCAQQTASFCLKRPLAFSGRSLRPPGPLPETRPPGRPGPR